MSESFKSHQNTSEKHRFCPENLPNLTNVTIQNRTQPNWLVLNDPRVFLNPQTGEEVSYTEQNHLYGQRREFCKRNNAQKTKENNVKTILLNLACLTPIKLPLCMSTGNR